MPNKFIFLDANELKSFQPTTFYLKYVADSDNQIPGGELYKLKQQLNRLNVEYEIQIAGIFILIKFK